MLLRVLVAFVPLLAFSSCQALGKIQEENCDAFCSRTYPLHTYPKAEHLESCKKGCKLFSELGDRNATRTKCDNACAEIYPDSPQYYACCLGCKESEAEANNHMYSLTPLVFVQHVYERFVSHVCHFLQRTFTVVFLQRETGKLVVIRGQLEPIPLPTDLNDDQDSSPSCQNGRCEVENSGRTSEEAPNSWLDCISRQSGLPRWILVLVLFLVVITMVWLCCATMVTSPTVSSTQLPRYGNQKMGLTSDVDYLLLYDPSEQVKIQPPKDDREAPPLPVKIPLDQI